MNIGKLSKGQQYLAVIILTWFVSAICYLLPVYIGYKVVAYILLVSVSLTAMVFDIMPVLLAAVLSALVWDFFFIPPHFTLHINNAEDALILLMYFIVALVNAVLTYKIRQIEKEKREKEEKANAVKLYDTLLNSLSHELRTPISTIIGASDNLMSNATKLTDEDKTELVTEISKASLRLNGQVENLLNMSRLESGFIKLNTDWCDINELVYEVVNKLEEELKDHKIEVRIKEHLPLFKIDFGLMEHVLLNLLNNAALYTPAGSVIKVIADSVNDKLILIVQDNGHGFPVSEYNKVFDKFYRLRNSRPGGSGLGLSIAKGFVEAHGGTIKLDSDSGEGASFYIEVPAETSYLNNLKNE